MRNMFADAVIEPHFLKGAKSDSDVFYHTLALAKDREWADHKQLAQKMGLHPLHVQRWFAAEENMRSTPDYPVMVKAMQTLSEIVRGDGLKPENAESCTMDEKRHNSHDAATRRMDAATFAGAVRRQDASLRIMFADMITEPNYLFLKDMKNNLAPFCETLYETLRLARNRHWVNYKQLAQKMGLPPSHVRRWFAAKENMRSTPEYPVIVKALQALSEIVRGGPQILMLHKQNPESYSPSLSMPDGTLFLGYLDSNRIFAKPAPEKNKLCLGKAWRRAKTCSSHGHSDYHLPDKKEATLLSAAFNAGYLAISAEDADEYFWTSRTAFPYLPLSTSFCLKTGNFNHSEPVSTTENRGGWTVASRTEGVELSVWLVRSEPI